MCACACVFGLWFFFISFAHFLFFVPIRNVAIFFWFAASVWSSYYETITLCICQLNNTNKTIWNDGFKFIFNSLFDLTNDFDFTVVLCFDFKLFLHFALVYGIWNHLFFFGRFDHRETMIISFLSLFKNKLHGCSQLRTNKRAVRWKREDNEKKNQGNHDDVEWGQRQQGDCIKAAT